MTVYLARSCPRCQNYFGVVIGEPKSESNVRPIRGRCANCGYVVNWTLFPGYGSGILLAWVILKSADMKIKDITEWSEHRGKLFVKYAYARYNDAQEIGNVTENVLTFRN